MTTRAVAEFFRTAEQDPNLARQIGEVSARERESWAAEVVRIARSAGFTFEAAEIDMAVAEQLKIERELGEDDLERVSGGARQQYSFYEAWPCKWYVPDLDSD